MQFFKSVRRAPGRATPSKDGVALRRFDDHRFKLLVRRHALSSHEHIALSSKSLTSCYTCAPITDHQFSGGVAERLIAPVLKTGRPKGLVSSNLTPSAIFKFRLSIVDFRLVAIGSTLQQARIKFPEPLRKRRQRDNGRRYTSLRLRSESGWGGTQGRRADAR